MSGRSCGHVSHGRVNADQCLVRMGEGRETQDGEVLPAREGLPNLGSCQLPMVTSTQMSRKRTAVILRKGKQQPVSIVRRHWNPRTGK